MAEVGARPRWRDALVLAVLAAVILGGLVHYGRALGGDDTPSAGGTKSPSASTSPTAEATAQLEGAPPTDPAAPPSPTGGTCWDGRETAALRLCGLPEGARGLAWVFPSFARDRNLCHPARPNDDSYPVVQSYECFQQALGQPVTVTYDQVHDPEQVERWLLARIGNRAPPGDPGRARRPQHLQGQRQPPGADHRACTRSSPMSSRSTPRARRPPSAPGRRSSGSAPPETVRGVRNPSRV